MDHRACLMMAGYLKLILIDSIHFLPGTIKAPLQEQLLAEGSPKTLGESQWTPLSGFPRSSIIHSDLL